MSDDEFNEAEAEAYLLAQLPTSIAATSRHLDTRHAQADTYRAALQQIRQLHAPMMMPIDGGLLMLCDHCCFDDAGHQTDDCATSHEHTADGPACHTTEIIARSGL